MANVKVEFEPARKSLAWAKEAASELKIAADTYFKGDIDELVTEIDNVTGEYVQRLRLKERLPPLLTRQSNEALSNARNAFDQATFAARNIVAGPNAKSVYFPWAQSPTDLGPIDIRDSQII